MPAAVSMPLWHNPPQAACARTSPGRLVLPIKRFFIVLGRTHAKAVRYTAAALGAGFQSAPAGFAWIPLV